MALLNVTTKSLYNIRIGGVFSIAARGSRKDYGYEEGHGEKNEVRKEKYWRKRNPARKVPDWREKQNLHPNVLAWGPASQGADWSYESGDPGSLNDVQKKLYGDNQRLVEEIHQAAMLVLKAKELENK